MKGSRGNSISALLRWAAALTAISVAVATSRGLLAASTSLWPGDAPAGNSEETDWVGEGRDALDSWGWWGYPWYEGRTDGPRAIRIAPPQTPGPAWNLSFLEGFFRVVAWVVIAAALVGLAYLLWRAFGRMRRSDSDASNLVGSVEALDPASFEALPYALDAGPTDLLGEVRRAYAAGDYSRAIVYLFSYQLLQLDRHHRIHLARGKTNRQYLRELAVGDLRQILERTMLAFEDVFFGRRSLPRARFEECWSRMDQFQALAAHVEGAA
ncbi:MAG: DUF4129 domain-containing protein [Planctomycetota bacterium]